MLSSVVDTVLSAPAWLVCLLVGLVVLVEDAIFVGFLVPGETFAVLGGVTAATGHTAVAVVLLVVCTCAVVGDSIGYEVGKAVGPRILNARVLASRRGAIDGAQDLLRRRGGVAVFLARWTAFFRAVMPALAGTSRMPYPRFLLWNAIGGITWGTAMVLIGFLAGHSYARVERWFGTGAAVVVAVVVVGGLVGWRVRTHRRQSPARAD